MDFISIARLLIGKNFNLWRPPNTSSSFPFSNTFARFQSFLFMVSHSCCVIVILCLFQAKEYGVPYKPHSNITWINSVYLPLGKLYVVWRDLFNLDTMKPINPFFQCSILPWPFKWTLVFTSFVIDVANSILPPLLWQENALNLGYYNWLSTLFQF